MHHHIKALIEKEFDAEVVIEKPKNKELGHFATPLAFTLAKIKKANPKILAEEIASTLRKYQEFDRVEAVNGFVNLTLSLKFLQDSSRTIFKAATQSQQKILLEFVSANPTGPLHIGHARGAIYGDCLARVGRWLGFDITTEYYINDAGTQIYLLGLSILLAAQEHILKQEVSYPESYYRGEYIIDLAFEARKHFGEEIFHSQDAIPTLSEFGKDKMLQEIKNNLAQVGIAFDTFVSEKALQAQWQNILQILQKHQGVYEEDSKIWLASSKHNDEKDRVIVRENGEPTYLAGDITYHHNKFARNFTHFINIWGADHHGYIARVKAAIHFLGLDETKLEVLLSQMVSLLKGGQPYKMSKRAGNFILMKDVVEDIGADALRFIFLSKKPDTHLEFDVDELKRQDISNPIYYINYANARIHTLLNKSNYTITGIDSETLDLDEEAKALLFDTLCLPQVLESSFRDREMQKICEYLKNLASSFHSFYNTHKILDTPNERSLLWLIKQVSASLTLGLSLLGIEAKTRM